MKFYKFAQAVLAPIIRLFFRIRCVGRENVPQGQGFLMCSNHISNLDPLIIACCFKQQIHYMAKAELFHNFFLRKLITMMGAFPVERGTGDRSAIERSKEIVRDGEVLGIFPEGTRSKDGKPLRPKSGAVLIASESGGDIVPVAVCCEGPVKLFGGVTIRIGKVIKNEEIRLEGMSAKELRSASQLMMGRIIALLEEGE